MTIIWRQTDLFLLVQLLHISDGNSPVTLHSKCFLFEKIVIGQLCVLHLLNDGSCLTRSRSWWLSCSRFCTASFFSQHRTLSGREWKCSSRANCTQSEQTRWGTGVIRSFRAKVELTAYQDQEADLYLNTFDEVPHWEVVVEEDADQHLHHFSIEFKRELWCQDQLKMKKENTSTTYDVGNNQFINKRLCQA